MKVDLSNDRLYGNEAAEDEDISIFESYAVERKEVKLFLDVNRPIAVVRAYKGEGKSALLRLVELKLNSQQNPEIVFRVSAPTISPVVDTTDSDLWIREWKVCILKFCACQIGSQINAAFTDDAMTLVETAQNNGFKEKSFVSSILSRIKINNLPIDVKPANNDASEQLMQRWLRGKPHVWLLVDDLDLNFQNTVEYKNKISSFFTAIRQIANTIPEIRIRASIRPNVWTLIKPEYEALSHVEQYVCDISWTLDDYYVLVSRRIQSLLESNGSICKPRKVISQTSVNKQMISYVFSEYMSWGKGDEKQPPVKILYTLSRRRPRWLIELWKSSGIYAAKRNCSIINFDHIKNALDSFSKNRLNDTVAEFKSQCPEITSLLSAFKGQPEWYSTDQLFKTIKNRVLQSAQFRIFGVLGSPTPIDVARFLYEIGFITARFDNPDGSYKHAQLIDEPMLLKNKSNIDYGASWEIHPVFRQALQLENVQNHSRMKQKK